MTEPRKRCMACAKVVAVLKGGICESCQEKIRREAMGEHAHANESANRELSYHGVAPKK